MKELAAAVVIGCVVVGLITAAVFYADTIDLERARVFDPAREEARRHTFETSKAYREGMAQELQSMQLDYIKGTPEQKEAIASMILHRTAGVRLETLPTDLQAFVGQVRRERGL